MKIKGSRILQHVFVGSSDPILIPDSRECHKMILLPYFGVVCCSDGCFQMEEM